MSALDRYQHWKASRVFTQGSGSRIRPLSDDGVEAYKPPSPNVDLMDLLHCVHSNRSKRHSDTIDGRSPCRAGDGSPRLLRNDLLQRQPRSKAWNNSLHQVKNHGTLGYGHSRPGRNGVTCLIRDSTPHTAFRVPQSKVCMS